MINYIIIPGLEGKTPHLDKIDIAAAEVWKINPLNLYDRTREREILEPRQVATYYKRKVLKYKPKKIEKLTGFDHATINHSCKVIGNMLQTSKNFKELYNEFLQKLN